MRSFSTLHILKYSVKASNGTINNNGLLGLHSGLFATQLWLFYNAICIEKPNAEGKLEFVIEKNTDQKEYDSILYYVAMLSNDGKYYAKLIYINK